MKFDVNDIVGKKFGKLTVLEFIKSEKSNPRGFKYYYLCQCDCGNTKIIRRDSLLLGYTKACGCIMKSRIKNIIGQKFGKLTVVSFHHKDKRGQLHYLCICDCGNEHIVRKSSLLNSHIRSCGCIVKKHGKSDTRIFKIWSGMKSRCLNTNSEKYPIYGGRNIKICDEWLTNFNNFYNWSIVNGYADNLSIDRIDVNGNYEPSNCRWIDNKQQANNRRNNHLITFNNETHTMAEWSDITGINYDTIKYRIKCNLPLEEIFTK